MDISCPALNDSNAASTSASRLPSSVVRDLGRYVVFGIVVGEAAASSSFIRATTVGGGRHD
jgi:hypothetical protein